MYTALNTQPLPSTAYSSTAVVRAPTAPREGGGGVPRPSAREKKAYFNARSWSLSPAAEDAKWPLCWSLVISSSILEASVRRCRMRAVYLAGSQ
jgi:hypothetical protein